VLDAITLYDLGYSLEETADKIRARHGHRVGRSTIAVWLDEHRSLTTYARLRPEGRRLFPPTQTIGIVNLSRGLCFSGRSRGVSVRGSSWHAYKADPLSTERGRKAHLDSVLS
jgi:hypothetical protein